jgi:hypothetical protein
MYKIETQGFQDFGFDTKNIEILDQIHVKTNQHPQA